MIKLDFIYRVFLLTEGVVSIDMVICIEIVITIKVFLDTTVFYSLVGTFTYLITNEGAFTCQVTQVFFLIRMTIFTNLTTK